MKFEVDTGQLAATHGSLQSALERVTTGQVRMYQAMETLESMWAGSAHDAFRSQFAADHQQMQELCREVQNVLELLDQARGAYESCDNEVQGWIARLQV